MSSTVALAAEPIGALTCKTLSVLGAGAFESPKMCCRMAECADVDPDGGEGKSMVLFKDGGCAEVGLRFLLALLLIFALGMEGKALALSMDGGAAARCRFFLDKALAAAYGAGRVPAKGPREGKLSAVKLDCRLKEAAAGAVGRVVVPIAAAATDATFPPPHDAWGACDAVVDMAANCRLVAPRLPFMAFFFAFASAWAELGNAGKDSAVTLPTLAPLRFTFCKTVPVVQPTSGALEPEAGAAACNDGNNSPCASSACCCRTAAACALSSSVRCTCNGCSCAPDLLEALLAVVLVLLP
jgi:hypothetical protein